MTVPDSCLPIWPIKMPWASRNWTSSSNWRRQALGRRRWRRRPSSSASSSPPIKEADKEKGSLSRNFLQELRTEIRAEVSAAVSGVQAAAAGAAEAAAAAIAKIGAETATITAFGGILQRSPPQ